MLLGCAGVTGVLSCLFAHMCADVYTCHYLAITIDTFVKFPVARVLPRPASSRSRKLQATQLVNIQAKYTVCIRNVAITYERREEPKKTHETKQYIKR